MRTRKFTGFIIMLFVMIFIAAASAVYADSVATVSNITVSGPTLTNLNYSSRVADVINNVKVNHSGLGISTEVQVYLGGEWVTCTSEEFFSGQYRLKMNIYSTDNTDTRYMIGSSPAVKYNGTECTIGNCTQYAVYAYTEPFYANAQYSLTVAGIPVTTVNSADILGDGSKKFVYDPAAYTLTVNGDYTYTNGSIIVNNGIKGLTINIAGDSVLTSNGSAIRCGKNDTTITGSGKLTLNSQNNIGIYINGEGAVLTIDNADINVSGNSAISGNSSTNEKLIINNSKITASGTNYAISSFGGGITLDNCKVLTPENPLVTAYDILDSNGRIAQNVTIGYTDYPLYIAGTQVTENNAANILGDGVFKYDPVTNTLTVNGSCTVSNGDVIRSNIDGLTIDITGDSVLTTENGTALDLGSTAAITSTQNRVLSINGPYGTGIVCNNFLNIINANITIKGNYGITNKISSAGGTLDINNSYIYLDTKKVNSAIRGFRTFTLDDCKITSPAGAVYKDYILYENDGETVASKVTIEPISEYPLTVAGIGVTRENAADILGNGSRKFTYDSKTKTLSVNGSYYYSGDFLIQNMGIEDLTIFIADNSDLHTTGGSTIYCKDYATTIKGTGKAKLQLFADNVCILTNSGSLAIEDLYLETNRGTSGVYGIKGMSKSKLTIRNSQIDVRATVSAISYFTDVEFEGCRIDIPYNAVNNGTVFESNGTTAAKTVTTKPNNYGLSIAGTSVNTLNAGDILGDGRFSFDAEAKTLYVNGDCTSSDILIYNTGVSGLTVNVLKDSTLTSAYQTIYSSKDMTITGNGKLTLVSNGYQGILCTGKLSFNNIDIDISGKWGIVGSSSNGITFNNINASINGTEYAIECSDFVLIDNKVISPTNYKSVNNIICDSDGTPAKNVEIHIDEYPLEIAGVTVTSRNMYDVLGNGVFSYDADTKTLTVKGNYTRTDTGSIIYNAGISGLTVNVTKNSKLSANGMVINGGNNDLTITTNGTNTLDMTANNAICIAVNMGNVVITNAKLTLNGNSGIIYRNSVKSGLTINNSSVEISAKGTDYGAISGFNSITFKGCEITSPEGAVNKNGAIYESNGETIANNVVITRLGDVNFDGVVNDADAKLILKYISTNKPMYADRSNDLKALHNADVDGSGSVDMLDVIHILKSA